MTQASRLAIDGFEITERRHDVRIMVNIPGRYSLASRLDEQGKRREFACRAVNMSTQAMVLATPVLGPVGEPVIAHIERFGRLAGSIARVLERGFVMSVTATEDERARIAEKLVWLEKHKNHELPDNRRSQRIAPDNPGSTLTLADGTRLGCFVIDMSATGAAVSADIFPEIGAAITVGEVAGRVVRRFSEGFAVAFIEPRPAAQLERLLIVA